MVILQRASSGKSLIYSRNRVGTRMELWGTAALTKYSYEDFLSRSNQSRLLRRKDQSKSITTEERPIKADYYRGKTNLKILVNLNTAWKVSKHGVFSDPYFPVFELIPYSVQIQQNTDQEKLRIWTLFMQWKFRKIWVSEEDQHARPYRNPWIYQVPRLHIKSQNYQKP